MSEIHKLAREFSNNPKINVHDATILGYQIGVMLAKGTVAQEAVEILKNEYEGFKDLVSYSIAASVLECELRAKGYLK